VQFFTAPGNLENPGASDFTQLGTDQSIAQTGIFDSNIAVEVGSIDAGLTAVLAGKVYRAMIYDGVFSTAAFGGTKQFDADFTTFVGATTSFTESSTNAATVTMQGKAFIDYGQAIKFIGSAAADTTSVTLPIGHKRGDLLVIFAFRGATTAPSLPAGWTSIANNSSGASSLRVGWKLAISSADTSGTWTNATGVVCQVFRGTATNKTPISAASSTTGSSTTVTYNNSSLNPMLGYGTSWVVGFAATKTTGSTLETAPTTLTNVINLVGAATEYAGHNSNGVFAASTAANQGKWVSTDVSVGGASAEWRSTIIEVFAEQGQVNNYQFADTGGGMGSTEKIR
jgi:hypothetical protein